MNEIEPLLSWLELAETNLKFYKDCCTSVIAERERLREALGEIAEFAKMTTKDATWIEERARAALEGK